MVAFVQRAKLLPTKTIRIWPLTWQSGCKFKSIWTIWQRFVEKFTLIRRNSKWPYVNDCLASITLIMSVFVTILWHSSKCNYLYIRVMCLEYLMLRSIYVIWIQWSILHFYRTMIGLRLLVRLLWYIYLNVIALIKHPHSVVSFLGNGYIVL